MLSGENRLEIRINGCVYTGTLEWFYLEPFRGGTDKLTVYMVSWDHSIQKVIIVVENIVVEHCPFLIALSRISPCLISERTWREPFWVFTRELLGTVPNGTYFLGGPVWVRIAVLYGTVPSVPVLTQDVSVPIWVRFRLELFPCKRCLCRARCDSFKEI